RRVAPQLRHDPEVEAVGAAACSRVGAHVRLLAARLVEPFRPAELPPLVGATPVQKLAELCKVARAQPDAMGRERLAVGVVLPMDVLDAGRLEDLTPKHALERPSRLGDRDRAYELRVAIAVVEAVTWHVTQGL